MAETCLPFQCNHVEGLWKHKLKKHTKTKREWRQTKGKRKGKKKKEEEGETAAEDLAWLEIAAKDEGVVGNFCGQPVASSTWCSPA